MFLPVPVVICVNALRLPPVSPQIKQCDRMSNPAVSYLLNRRVDVSDAVPLVPGLGSSDSLFS